MLILYKQAVITRHHRANNCGFPLACFNCSSHLHNPLQPGFLLLFCTTLQLCHITIFNLFFLFSQIVLWFVLQVTAICRAVCIWVSKHSGQRNAWRVKVSREQAQRHYANAAADSATVKGGLRLHPSQGPRLRAPKHTAFLKAHGAAGWAEGQICSQRLIHNSQGILFWKACSGQKAGLSQETRDSSTIYFPFSNFLIFSPLCLFVLFLGLELTA